MTLLENWDFYLGALAACISLEAVAIAGLFQYIRSGNRVRRSLSPVLFFLVPYFAFLAIGYLRPFLNIQDVPSVQPAVFYAWTADPYVVALYVLGGVAFFAGYSCFAAIRRRYGRIGRFLIGDLFRSLKAALGGRKVPYFIAAILILWLIGLVANIALFFQVRGIPLFHIGIRESADPKLTFLAEFQPTLVLLAPFVTILHDAVPPTYQRLLRPMLYSAMVVVSLVALTLLGARNLPAKLALGLFLFWLLSPMAGSSMSIAPRAVRRPHVSTKAKIALLLGLLLFVSIGVAGAWTKVEIYGMSPQDLPGAVAGTPVADSIGNLFSFQAVVNYSGLHGHFSGNLLYTTFLSYIPGRDEFYANYIVGEVLGYPLSELESIASTFSGPSFLDFGVLGLVFNTFLFGALLRYGWDGVRDSARNLGAFALLLATLVLDIHLGTYNLWTFFAVLLLVSCVEYNKVP